MNVIQGAKYSLEGETFSCHLILVVCSWAAALEYGNEKPGCSKKSVDGHTSNDDSALPFSIDYAEEENGKTEFEDHGRENIETEDAHDQL